MRKVLRTLMTLCLLACLIYLVSCSTGLKHSSHAISIPGVWVLKSEPHVIIRDPKQIVIKKFGIVIAKTDADYSVVQDAKGNAYPAVLNHKRAHKPGEVRRFVHVLVEEEDGVQLLIPFIPE
jgi:hypothetical protein